MGASDSAQNVEQVDQNRELEPPLAFSDGDEPSMIMPAAEH